MLEEFVFWLTSRYIYFAISPIKLVFYQAKLKALTNGETAFNPVACHVATRALVAYGQYQNTGLLRRFVV